MQINVSREGREGVYIPEKDSLISWIAEKDFNAIHNFIPTSMMMLGADHSQASVIADIKGADRLAITTSNAWRQNMSHALALIKDEKLELFDIGEIKEEDLAIV